MTIPYTPKQSFAQAFYSYSYEPQQYYSDYHHTDNNDQDNTNVFQQANPKGYRETYHDIPMGTSSPTEKVAFSPVVVACPHTPRSRPRLSPTVSRYTDMQCYKDSANQYRMPHGLVSTDSSRRFATLTTYPQVGISLTESHPGMFAEYAQVIGIVYPPFLFQPNSTDERNVSTTIERARMHQMNPYIDWPEHLLLPLWNESMCHVFNTETPDASGCSALPRVPTKVTPDCGRYEPPGRNHKAASHCRDRYGETSQEANETGKDPIQKHARYPPRSKFLTPELTRIRRMYAEKAVSCQHGTTLCKIDGRYFDQDKLNNGLRENKLPTSLNVSELTEMFPTHYERRKMGGHIAYSVIDKTLKWYPLHSFCFGGYLTFTNVSYGSGFNFIRLPPDPNQVNSALKANLRGMLSHYTAPVLDYMFAQVVAHTLLQKTGLGGNTKHQRLDAFVEERYRFKDRHSIIADLIRTRTCQYDKYINPEGVPIHAYDPDKHDTIGTTDIKTYQRDEGTDFNHPMEQYVAYDATTCGFLQVRDPYTPAHEYFCSDMSACDSDHGHLCATATGCEHQGGPNCTAVIGDFIFTGTDKDATVDAKQTGNTVSICKFSDKQQTPMNVRRKDGGIGLTDGPIVTDWDNGIEFTKEVMAKRMWFEGQKIPFTNDWQRWFCSKSDTFGKCNDAIENYIHVFDNFETTSVPCTAGMCTTSVTEQVRAYVARLGITNALVRDICYLECANECTLACKTSTDTNEKWNQDRRSPNKEFITFNAYESTELTDGDDDQWIGFDHNEYGARQTVRVTKGASDTTESVQDGRYERPEIYAHPVRLPHMVVGTELGSNYGFLRRAGAAAEHLVCSNVFFSWEPSAVYMGAPVTFYEPHGARQCYTSLHAKADGVTDFGSDTDRRRPMMLTVRHTQVPEYLAFIDRHTWLGGTAVAVDLINNNPEGATYDRDDGNDGRNRNFLINDPDVAAVRLYKAGFNIDIVAAPRNDVFLPDCRLEVAADGRLNSTLSGWTNEKSSLDWSRSMRPNAEIRTQPWFTAANGELQVCQDVADSIQTRLANQPIDGYNDKQATYWGEGYYTAGVALVHAGGRLCMGLPLGGLYGFDDDMNPTSKQTKQWEDRHDVKSPRRCTHSQHHTAELRFGSAAENMNPLTTHTCRITGTSGLQSVAQLEYTPACHGHNNPFPGVQWAHGNLANAFYLQEYPIIVPHTGWAPSLLRDWSAAVQNSERHASFACDCRAADPVYACIPMFPADTTMTRKEQVALHGSELDSAQGQRIIPVQCSFTWGGSVTKGFPPAGLYMGSQAKLFESVDLDVFAHADDNTFSSLTHAFLSDDNFTHSMLDYLIFSGAEKSYWGKRRSYVSSCLRWPYGQIHPRAFPPDMRARLWPPKRDLDPDEYLHGYCDIVNNKPVYCRNDNMPAKQRTEFCAKQGKRATNTVAGYILSRDRTLEQSCNYDAKLCLFLPGYGVSLAAFMQQLKQPDMTVLVAPFGKKNLEVFMLHQIRHQVGQVDLNATDRDTFLKTTNGWYAVDETDTSYMGIGQMPEAFLLFAGIRSTDTTESVRVKCNAFANMLTQPSTCDLGTYMMPDATSSAKDGLKCVPKDTMFYTLNGPTIIITQPGTTMMSAVALPIPFVQSENSVHCNVFHVGVPRVTLSNMLFNQANCATKHAWNTVPIKLSGTDVSHFTLRNAAVSKGTTVAVMALGSHTSEFPFADTLNVNEMFLSVNITADLHFVAAFARCTGMASIYTDTLTEVLVQPASDDHIVHILGGYGTGGTRTDFQVINVAEYTSMYGMAYLTQLYSKPPQHGFFYWAAASLLLLFTLSLLALHAVTLFKYKTAGSLVARLFAKVPPNSKHHHYSIKNGTVTLQHGRKVHFYDIVADVVFAGSECYKEHYEHLYDLASHAFDP